MIGTRFVSKLAEFDQFEPRIVQRLPETQELDRAPASQPILDNVRRRIAVAVLRDIGERDVILPLLRNDGNSRALNVHRVCHLSPPPDLQTYRIR